MVDVSNRNRQPEGQTIGGQFAHEHKGESGVELGGGLTPGLASMTREEATQRTQDFLVEKLAWLEGSTMIEDEERRSGDDSVSPHFFAAEALEHLGYDDPSPEFYMAVADALFQHAPYDQELTASDVADLSFDVANAIHQGEGWSTPVDMLPYSPAYAFQEEPVPEGFKNRLDGQTFASNADWRYDSTTGVPTLAAEVHFHESQDFIHTIPGYIPERDNEHLAAFLKEKYGFVGLERTEAGVDGSMVFTSVATRPMEFPTQEGLNKALEDTRDHLQGQIASGKFRREAAGFISARSRSTGDYEGTGQEVAKRVFEGLSLAAADDGAFKRATTKVNSGREDFAAVAQYATANYGASPESFRKGAAMALRAGVTALRNEGEFEGSDELERIRSSILTEGGQADPMDMDHSIIDLERMGEGLQRLRAFSADHARGRSLATGINALEAARGHLGRIVAPGRKASFDRGDAAV